MPRTLEDLIFDVVGESAVPTYGRPVGVLHDRGGGSGQGVGGARNRGVPGYPVPPEMAHRGGTEEPGGMEVLEAKKVPKSIEHVEDLSPDDFMAFIRKYADLPASGGLEATEKVDGSARLTFGVDLDGLWTQTKNGVKKYSASGYPTTPKYRAVRAAAEALESARSDIMRNWSRSVSAMTGDVLYGRIPNTIEYGQNVIVVHGVYNNEGEPWGPEFSRKFVSVLQRAVGDMGGWRLEHVQSVDPSGPWTDIGGYLGELDGVYRELKRLEPDRRKAVGKERYQEVLARFRDIQRRVKEALLGDLRGRRSAYGPEGGEIEGLVFRDLESCKLTKLVDRDYFTKLNKYYWQWRELLERGAQVGDQWQVGIMQDLRNSVADDVLGVPMAKSSTFVSILRRFADSLEYPEQVRTPEQRVNFALARWAQEYSPSDGDLVGRFLDAVHRTQERFRELRGRWQGFRANPEPIELRGQKHGYPQEIRDRTDEAFSEMEAALAGIEKGAEVAATLRTPLSQKVALVKLVLGQRLDRIQESVAMRDRGPIDLGGGQRIDGQVTETVDDIPHSEKYSQELEYVWSIRDRIERRIGTTLAGARNLGEGTQGVALGLTDGTVLKITHDRTEAKAETMVLGKNLPHVIRVFDIFELPNRDLYGVRQEQLQPLSRDESNKIDRAFNHLDIIAKNFFDGNTVDADSWSRYKEHLTKSPDTLSALESISFPEMLQELRALGIKFSDFHSGNIMKRGGEYIVIDLGYSRSIGHDPDILESLIRKVVREVVAGGRNPSADTIGATIGRFQPFHIGHAAVIRELANRFTKVIVFVAGQRKDSQNPFDHDLRLEMMKLSLPDVYQKLEIYPAVVGGKGTGYVPGLLEYAAESGQSSLEPTSAVNILVGDDRLASVRQQIQHNSKHQEEPGHFKGTLNVTAFPGVGEDDAGRISGTRIREALLKDDREGVRDMMDPHLAGSDRFEDIYARMRTALVKHEMVEAILTELGMGALETGAGSMHSGDWGSSAWSRAWLADDEADAESMYQRVLGSPTRMLPMNNKGQPNACLPGFNGMDGPGADDEDLRDKSHDPTDLGETIIRTVISKLEK